MNGEDKFDYTYSAPTENERREIESIRKQYESKPGQESKLEKLRRLNKLVTYPPKIACAIIAVIGALVLGTGMTMALEWGMTVWGAVVGVLGIAVAAASYPVYKLILKRNKRKYGRLIIDLSNELLNIEKQNP